MKTSVRFLNLILGCACVALIPVSAAQSAEPELQFRPAERWSTAEANNICSIQTTFNNGFTMRFLGNEKWARAMDLDFKQNIFTEGQAYDATLSIPGVTTQSVKAEAQSGSLLAFGIGQDSTFYKSLKQSPVVDLNLDGNEFRFYLTGFANSAAPFETCMAGAASTNVAAQDTDQNFMVNEAVSMEAQLRAEPPTEVVEITPDAPQPVVQEIPYTETKKVGDYTVSSSDLGLNDAETITQINADAKAMAEVPSRVGANSEKRLSQQLAEQIANDPSLIEVDNDTPYIERKKLEVPEEIAAMPIVPDEGNTAAAPIAPPSESAEATDDMMIPPPQDTLAEPAEEPVEAEIAAAEEIAAQTEPAAAPEAAPETSPAVEPMDEPEPVTEVEVETETAMLVEETVAEEPKRVYAKTQEMKIKTENMQGEADFRVSDANGLGRENKDLRKDVIKLEAMLRELKAENEALNSELKGMVRDSEQERLSIASENWNLEQATMKFNEAERQIQRLGQQLQKERAQCSLEKRELESMLFDPQVTEQEQLARLSALERDLVKAERELESQRLRYEERIRQLESTQ